MDEDYTSNKLYPQGTEPLILNLYQDEFCSTPSAELSVSIVEGDCHILQDKGILSVMIMSNPACEFGAAVLGVSDEADCGSPNSSQHNISLYETGQCQIYTAGASIGSLWFGCKENLGPTTTTIPLDPNLGVPTDPSLSVRDAEKETALTAAVVCLSIALALFGLMQVLTCIYCPFLWLRMYNPRKAKRAARREGAQRVAAQ